MRDQDIALPDAGTGPAQRGPGAPGDRPAGATASTRFRQDCRPEWLAAQQGSARPARWLTATMLSLAVLAAAAAVVSYAAQYRMVFAAKAIAPVAALEAAIPDVAAL